MPNKYSVLLPTYNEKENLPIIVYLIFEMAEKHNLDFEIIIIDDNSPDGTYEIAKSLKQKYGEKIILHWREAKLGLGSAYQDGLKFSTGNFVILMDADLSHHPKYLPQFIKKQEETGAEIVTGTRYLKNGGVYGWDFKRKLTSRVANFIAKVTLGNNCSDLTGSFRLYKKEAIQSIINEIISKGYAFQMEIIIRAAKKNYKVEEVPIVFVDRVYGLSKLGSNEVYSYLLGVWNLFWKL